MNRLPASVSSGQPESDLTPLPKAAPRHSQRRLTVVFWFVALLLGFLQAWHARFTIGHGPVSYLDMGDAFFRGDWAMALNGYFNPLYAWVLGLALHWLRPTAYWEYPLVHLVVFVSYVFALCCFAFFLEELLHYRETLLRQHATVDSLPGRGTVASAGERRLKSRSVLRPPLWVWIVLGYSVFIWSSIDLIGVAETNPDMLIAAFFYLASGLVLRIRAGSATWLTFVLLGATLGLGYLTKSAFFPLAFVFLGVGLFAVGQFRRAVPRIGVSLLVFAMIAGPWILALSIAKGRPTFGDAGRLSYAWYVKDVPIRHWQGSSESGIPIHPTRRLFKVPATYEFGGPVGGTYPAVYDISYWYEGLKVRFSLRQQIVALWESLRMIGTLFLRLNGSLFWGAVLMAFASGRRRALLKDLMAYWVLLIPGLAGLLMYALITIYGRYVGPFAPVLILVVFVAIPLPDSREARGLMAGLAIAPFVMLVAPVGPSAIPKYWSDPFKVSQSRNLPWQVAYEVRKLGVLPAGKIASVSYSKERNMAWARLARVQIVAEVFYSASMPATYDNDFWRASPAAQREILAAFADAGAEVAVSDEKPRQDPTGGATLNGWERLGRTDFYAYRLVPHASGPRP